MSGKLRYYNGTEWEQIAPTKEEFDEHKAESVSQVGGAHGFIYEEGTWIPSLSFGGNSVGIAYSVQDGKYKRMGRVISCEVSIILTNKGTSVGVARIDGLPFSTSSSTIQKSFSFGELQYISTPANATQLFGVIGSTSYTGIDIRASVENAASSVLTNINFANNSVIRFVFTYHI